jgi:carboxylate-amine ligase
MTEPVAVAAGTERGDFTIGVEEEYLVLDAGTGAPLPEGELLVGRGRQRLGDAIQTELQRAQLEVSTPVCGTLAEVGEELHRLRREVSSVATSAGAVIAAAGTHPFASCRDNGGVTPAETYLRLERDYQQLAREQLICGCHVHVGIADPELAVQVMNRVRPWLSVVLALSANSPFWAGTDTGYASYRTEIWRRWPTAGTPEVFEDRAEYDRLVETLIATGSIDAPARIYWDVRPSARFSTVEFRVTDVCLTVDEAVMVAGLVRGLARACSREAAAGAQSPRPRPELLRAATWRAARYGVQADLVDVMGGRAMPAADVVGALLGFLRPVLEEAGDWAELSELVRATLARGTGADRQRAAYAGRRSSKDVVDLIVAETVAI